MPSVSLIEFSRKAYILPCPGGPTASLNSTEFGMGDDCNAAAPTMPDLIAVNAGTNQEVWIGSAPTRMLNLPDSYMFDGWGNRIRYAVIKKLATGPDDVIHYIPDTYITNGVIQILDGYGQQIMPVNDRSIIGFALVSFGKDSKGAQKRSGVTSDATCPANSTVKGEENCDDDAVFVDASYNDGTVAAEYYDDVIRWQQLYALKPSPDESAVCTLPGSTDLPRLASGYFYSCVIDGDGKLYCWGRNDVGQVGNGTSGNSCYPSASGNCEVPDQITAFDDWQTVDADYLHTCAIRDNGKLYCWGDNSHGGLGRGNTTDSTVPVLIDGQSHDITDWVQVSVDGDATCALRRNGEAYCWGFNDAGQTGDGTTTERRWPTKVSGSQWSFISTSDKHACGVRCGHAYCWGDGSNGKLGNGSTADRILPTEVAGGITDWIQVSTDAQMTCGLRANGKILCWGDNTHGALGNGGGSNSSVPVPLEGDIASFTNLDVGGYGGCALHTNDELYCWGSNQYGQLGTNNAPADSPIPVQVPGHWIQMSTTAQDVCGVKDNFKGYCWGRNRNFEGGNGTNTMNDSPAAITEAPLNF
ncbi:MAG: hypothetical protein U1E36_10105 [Rickettsiales bacterium]